jgi:hypothetical protein
MGLGRTLTASCIDRIHALTKAGRSSCSPSSRWNTRFRRSVEAEAETETDEDDEEGEEEKDGGGFCRKDGRGGRGGSRVCRYLA